MTEENTPQQEEAQDNLPANEVNVEDVGTLKKKVTVKIARERIDAKRDEMFGELSGTAQIPGFRIGHAPRRLLEKRFGKEVTTDVRNALLGESINKALEDAELKSLGDPDLDLENITVPEDGEFEFSFEVEVAPEFDLPELKGIEVKKPAMEIDDERVDQEIQNWAQSQAQYEPTEDAAAEGDVITGAAKLTIEGQDAPIEKPGLTLRVAPGQIEGIPMVDLAKELTGKKADKTVKFSIDIPETHPNEAWQGKKADIEITISQVRRRNIPEINDEFSAKAGFETMDELRDFIRTRMTSRLEVEIRQAMHNQVQQYLLENTNFDLPEGLTNRHTAQLLQRRAIDLLQRGVSREQIDENLTQLQAAASEQAQRDLKLQFITTKIAEENDLKITPEEINARIAQMAAMYGRRPERIRQELASDGTLEQLYLVVLEEKAIDLLMETAEITEAEVGEETEEKKTSKKTEKKAAKKTEKKTSKKTTKKASKKDDE